MVNPSEEGLLEQEDLRRQLNLIHLQCGTVQCESC